MQEELITFETAKLAKEKGLCKYFENINGAEYVPAFYSEDGINFEETEFQQEDCTIDDRYFRPTQSLLQKWLREVHGIYVYVDGSGRPNIRDKREKSLAEVSKNGKYAGFEYEEALEMGLQEGLKIKI
jgi:hypothetical protein